MLHSSVSLKRARVMLVTIFAFCSLKHVAAESEQEAPLIATQAEEARALSPGVTRVCDGFEQEWDVCEGPSCNTCVPINCKFGAWQEWFDAGGCSQVGFRQRNIAVSNNECGQPCDGAKIESMRMPKPECTPDEQDCILSDWEDWTGCDEDVLMQSTRSRKVLQEPALGGKTHCRECSMCDHLIDVSTSPQALKETRVCDVSYGKKCELRSWHDWTLCSQSCGVGQRTRMRRIGSHAEYPGLVCDDVLSEVGTCILQDCPQADCKTSAWAEWSACLDKHSQTYRNRYIESPVLGEGAPCVGPLQETKPCPKPPVINCIFSLWSHWSQCSRTCDIGQTIRSRTLTREPENGGTCDKEVTLKETKPCHMPECFPTVEPCVFGAWSSWTLCSAKCGQGAIYRNRTIASFAIDGGKGCLGSLNEIGNCEGKECGRADCKWSNWYDWSACTCTCGGGTRTRSRSVAQSPRLGGKLCDENSKSEMALCNTQSCDDNYIDASWGMWADWTPCSSTCSEGFTYRSRRVAQEATCSTDKCGEPLKGNREEFKACSNPGNDCLPSQDCLLGEWSDWSYCSCSCYGNRERNRVIAQFARGTGKACVEQPLKECEPCNPSEGQIASPACGVFVKVNCELSAWTEWSTCSKTCGGGQKEMTRRIVQYPKFGGEPCSGELKIIKGCSDEACTVEVCRDCKWGDWGEWGHCSHCGGQRFRFRHILELPNHCGRSCEEASAKEVGSCHSTCAEKLSCAWSDWSSTSGCQANSCGGSSMRTRTLGLIPDNTSNPLFKAPVDALCTGTQLFTATCDRSACKPECVPQDCTFAEWGQWTQQTCLGLCYRSRVIAKHNNHCGDPCVGDIEETKRCDTDCDKPTDCILSEWTDWSVCDGPNGQESRSRMIKQFPNNGGAKCKGVLASTRSCGIAPAKACELSLWTSWSACSKMCDWGYQTRSRTIVTYASGGGELCMDDLESLQACKLKDCDAGSVDCSMSVWSPWSECDAMRLKKRERSITALAVGNGVACMGGIKETTSCGLEKRDCEMSEWTKWDGCDRSCGGGQQQRHRQIHTFPKNGGKSCPETQIMQRGCNTQPCRVQECILSAWTHWSKCGGDCGTGQVVRTRVIKQEPAEGGEGCKGPMAETQSCAKALKDLPPCPSQDCIWDDWSHWSSCTCSCDGGQMNRVRHIKVMPTPGGKPCSNEQREQVKPCNTQSCKDGTPTNGEWGDWSSWAPCSATCKTGTTFRLRRVAKMASASGSPPYGMDRESAFCNEDVQCEPDIDCVFSKWEEWGDCSMSCTGVKRRSRHIALYGKGRGKHCIGPMKETYPCNPGLEEKVPEGCGPKPPVDCVLGDWGGWSQCSATCGDGQAYRSREVLTPPSYGGKPCGGDDGMSATLAQVSPCKHLKGIAVGPCDVPPPINCVYGDWEDWNACGKCGGQRKRFRHIVVHAQNGGLNCEQFDSEELGSCPFYCEQHGYCIWGDWGAFGPCTARCGKGKKMRSRKLMFTLAKTDERLPKERPWLNKNEKYAAGKMHDYVQQYEELSNESESMKASGPHEMFAAFGLGFFFVGAAVVGFKVFIRGRSNSRGQLERDEARGLFGAVSGDESSGGRNRNIHIFQPTDSPID